MTLRARCRVERRAAGPRGGRDRAGFVMDVDVEMPARGVSAVFGPSGSGKTTLLRCIAGLEPTVTGEVRFGDEVWLDASGDRVPTHRRGAAYVFQEADLFGHLSVRDNLAYAARRARVGTSAGDVTGWLGVTPLLDRRPGELSGGERQRVSIARALAANPRLLLMDEPLSSLDEASRHQILPYLDELHDRLSIPVVYVTHSIAEIVRLADHVVWLDQGRVRAAGALRAVLRDAGFAAALGDDAGVLVDATVEGHDPAHHLTHLAGPWGPIRTRMHAVEPGARVRLGILARDVSLGLDPEPRSSILNTFPMRVHRVVDEGPGQVLVELVGPSTTSSTTVGDAGADGRLPGSGSEASPGLLARVTTLSAERLGLEPGLPVFARVKSVALAED